MTKPTGRPRGRPKTKEYVTLMARVDVALADQVKRYAALHRQPLSVVMRDALALFMEEYPAGGDRTVPHQLTAHDFLSDRYEAPLDMLLAETDSTERDALLSDTHEAVVNSILSDTNTDTHIVSDTKTPAYDATRFMLGALCKQGHDYDGQGHSLRYLRGDKDCRTCREARSARNAAQANKTRAKRIQATQQVR